MGEGSDLGRCAGNGDAIRFVVLFVRVIGSVSIFIMRQVR